MVVHGWQMRLDYLQQGGSAYENGKKKRRKERLTQDFYT